MNIFFLQTMTLIGLSQAFFFHDESDLCITEELSINCLCENYEDITLSAPLSFDVIHVLVKGCGKVNVPLGALTHLQLETIEFLDIKHLTILPFAFAGMQGIHSLRIADVPDLILNQHGFVGLSNLTKFMLSNVTAEIASVESFAFTSSIDLILIENSMFKLVESEAFIVPNVTTLQVVNSKFLTLLNVSFLVKNSEEVTFENCDFLETDSSAFIFYSVKGLSFLNCRFGVLGNTSILSKDLQTFTFANSTIEELQSLSFAFVQASDKIAFTNNVIKKARRNSLDPIISEHFSMEECCNSFTCDCNIYWMWNSYLQEGYDSLLKNSMCIGDPTTNISMLAPILNSTGECISLESTSSQNFPKSLPNASNRASARNDKNFVLKVLVLSAFLLCLN